MTPHFPRVGLAVVAAAVVAVVSVVVVVIVTVVGANVVAGVVGSSSHALHAAMHLFLKTAIVHRSGRSANIPAQYPPSWTPCQYVVAGHTVGIWGGASVVVVVMKTPSVEVVVDAPFLVVLAVDAAVVVAGATVRIWGGSSVVVVVIKTPSVEVVVDALFFVVLAVVAAVVVAGATVAQAA